MDKKSSWFLNLALSFLVGIVMSLGISTVFASESGTSASGYFTVYGQGYENWSSITCGNDFANTSSRIMTQEGYGHDVPAGYMGSKGRLFDSKDNLITQTSMIYNSSSTYYLNSDFASKAGGALGNYYYGYGITAAYNGNGYDQYYTFKTPNILAQ